jgi:S-DNA-T family DNA segregation ATPase FtsK/SpoIIIE
MAQQKKTTKKSTTQRTKRSEPVPSYSPRREIMGGLCLLLALFVIVSYFGVAALFIDFFGGLLKGLIGYGYYIAAAALVLCGVILIGHKNRPVAWRAVCALLIPVVLGAVFHLFLCAKPYAFTLTGAKELWADGRSVQCGGVVSGLLAVGGEAVFSKVVMLIVLILLLGVLLFVALRVSPAALAQRARERAAEREAQAQEEEELPPESKAPVIEIKRRSAPAAAIDIPLDGEERSTAPANEAQALTGKRSSFFVHRAKEIKTPDELLAPRPEASAIPAEPMEPAADSGETPPEEAAPTPRRKARTLGREQVAEAAEQVGRQIEETPAAEDTYRYPPITLLDENRESNYTEVGAELRGNSKRLAETLRSFGVDAKAGEVVHGPSVTRYEFILDQGVKLSKITNLSDDIALALGASGVRIAPIPNKISVVGIEVPNRNVTSVRIRDVVESREFVEHKSRTAFSIGKDIGGNSIVGDVSRLPHVLIAGTTGSGKSVCTNSLIVSMLYKSTPEEVRFIMVDPKMVELAPYNGIPHLLIPVVTDPKKAAGALQWAVYEMMKRYKSFSEKGVKDLKGYNALAETDEDVKKLPTVVVVIDELADLMLVAAKEVEESICRVAQMGRAAGMHLVIATQRPSADVITGLMKANIPSRIAFAVASSLESRIILDTQGAEKLVGKGDMLYFPLGAGKPLRVQGCFITPEEIERVVSFVKETGEADYSDEVMQKIEENMQEKEKSTKQAPVNEPAADDGDELLPAAIEVILETGQASVSMLQRRLKLGYSRAARLVDQMEERGIVGPFEGSKPRQLLITRQQWQEMQMQGTGSDEGQEDTGIFQEEET